LILGFELEMVLEGVCRKGSGQMPGHQTQEAMAKEYRKIPILGFLG
jgi:hypothetical protein